jgi:hypothetical protein
MVLASPLALARVIAAIRQATSPPLQVNVAAWAGAQSPTSATIRAICRLGPRAHGRALTGPMLCCGWMCMTSPPE